MFASVIFAGSPANESVNWENNYLGFFGTIQIAQFAKNKTQEHDTKLNFFQNILACSQTKYPCCVNKNDEEMLNMIQIHS